VEKVRAFVFSDRIVGVGLDAEDDRHRDTQRTLKRTEKMAEELGKQVVADAQAFAELLPELLNSNGQLLWNLGRGLAGGAADDSVEPTGREILGSCCYPFLQTAIGIDEKGVNRLMQSLALGLAPAGAYWPLSGGRSADPIPGPAFQKLLMEIEKKQGGLDVSIEVLYMRLISCEGRKEDCDPESIDAGCRRTNWSLWEPSGTCPER